MRTPQNFAGAYCVNTPRGDAVSPAGLLAPCGGVLDGFFCYAGKAHHGGNATVWNGERLIDLGIEAYGAGQGSPCCFGPLGLYVSTVGEKNVKAYNRDGVLQAEWHQEIGVEGIVAVVNGQVKPRKAWYGRDGFGYYCEFGNVRIGQGAQGGLIASIYDPFRQVWPLKLLEPGPWEFLSFGFADGVYAVAASQFALNRAAARWFSLQDIQNAPDYRPNSPVPVPVPVPPKPEPPKPMAGITDAQFDTLVRIRNTYGDTLNEAQIGELLNTVAWLHRIEGVGMQRKDAGTNCTQPRTGIKMWRGMRFAGNIGQDVLGSASIGKCIPTRGTVGPADPNTFVAPVDPLDQQPPPDPPPVSDLETRVSVLEQRIAHLLSVLHSA